MGFFFTALSRVFRVFRFKIRDPNRLIEAQEQIEEEKEHRLLKDLVRSEELFAELTSRSIGTPQDREWDAKRKLLFTSLQNAFIHAQELEQIAHTVVAQIESVRREAIDDHQADVLFEDEALMFEVMNNVRDRLRVILSSVRKGKLKERVFGQYKTLAPYDPSTGRREEYLANKYGYVLDSDMSKAKIELSKIVKRARQLLEMQEEFEDEWRGLEQHYAA